jgi:hypothetical protein
LEERVLQDRLLLSTEKVEELRMALKKANIPDLTHQVDHQKGMKLLLLNLQRSCKMMKRWTKMKGSHHKLHTSQQHCVSSS